MKISLFFRFILFILYFIVLMLSFSCSSVKNRKKECPCNIEKYLNRGEQITSIEEITSKGGTIDLDAIKKDTVIGGEKITTIDIKGNLYLIIRPKQQKEFKQTDKVIKTGLTDIKGQEYLMRYDQIMCFCSKYLIIPKDRNCDVTDKADRKELYRCLETKNTIIDNDRQIIEGTIKDSEGNPLSGVEVSCSGVFTISNSLGFYSLKLEGKNGQVRVTFVKGGFDNKSLDFQVGNQSADVIMLKK